MNIGPITLTSLFAVVLIVIGASLCFRPLMGIMLIGCGLLLFCGKINVSFHHDNNGFQLTFSLFKR